MQPTGYREQSRCRNSPSCCRGDKNADARELLISDVSGQTRV